MKQNKSRTFVLIGIILLMRAVSFAQTMDNITFSAVASNNNNFQPVIGAPYSSSLIGANGSLEISASYGESAFIESSLSIGEFQHQSSVRVFPNPTTYHVFVEFSEIQKGFNKLLLLDMNGKIVFCQTSKSSTEKIDMSTFSAGSYILQVQTSLIKLETFKIVKTQ